ncbi:hypothetical protein [Rhodoferax fermentans]|uniref:Uncharacterized protein n=1 Tax=Rhodoferax fermentans TaxID=28066 RepID=A0A1T1AP05_RHOFE|nr:hypothetical protein [Rhodoferax fermentans]MBK1683397.1 hypothetical protein [Rhodoferax fermentans]OOV05856.1 hypothetical protein RF819_03235 [Rhodoferax fermentans]
MATKNDKAAALPTKTYKTLTQVEHDQVKYGAGQPAGDELELTDAQAEPLLGVKAVELKAVAAEA